MTRGKKYYHLYYGIVNCQDDVRGMSLSAQTEARGVFTFKETSRE